MADAVFDGTDVMGEFVEKAQVSRTRRATRWRSVLSKRSLGLVLRACVVTALWCAAGMPPV